MTDDIIARLSAPVPVKPLEWHQLGPMPVWHSDNGHEVRLHTTCPGYYYGGRTWPDLEAAQAAAQADYEARVLADIPEVRALLDEAAAEIERLRAVRGRNMKEC